jgi:hypothetical protein
MMRWAWHVVSMGRKTRAQKVFMGKAEEQRQLGRTWRGGENNIKMDLKDRIGGCSLD